MRAPRAYLAGFGTSGSLLAGAALLFLLASAFIGFHGWPQVGDSPSTVAVSVPPAGVGTATSPASRVLAGTSVGGASLGGLGTSGAAGPGATVSAAGRLNGGTALGGVPGHQGATSFGGPGGQSGAPPSQCVGSACAQTSPGGSTIPSIPNPGSTAHKIVTTVKGILPGTSGGSTSPSTIVHHVTSTAGSAVHHVTSGAGSAVHHVTSGAGSAVHHVASGVHHVASGVGSAVHHLLP